MDLTAKTAGGVVLLDAGADEVHTWPSRFRGRGVAVDLHRVGVAGGGHSALHAEVINRNLKKYAKPPCGSTCAQPSAKADASNF